MIASNPAIVWHSNIAEFEDNLNSIENAITYALDQIGKNGFTVKEEQKEAICNVVASQDVMVALPTGFGKSLILHRHDF